MYKNQKRGDKPLAFGFGADEGTQEPTFARAVVLGFSLRTQKNIC